MADYSRVLFAWLLFWIQGARGQRPCMGISTYGKEFWSWSHTITADTTLESCEANFLIDYDTWMTFDAND